MSSTSNFLAPIINTELLPVPDAIETVDSEALLSKRMADFQTRATQAGFDYDVGALETDPIKIDQEVHALREMLMRARVNSAVRAVLPAYAQGADLDGIVARANVERAVLVPAVDDTPAIMESDTALLVRYLAGYATPSAGSVDGITYRVLTAQPALRDVAVIGPAIHGEPGTTRIYLLSQGGQSTPAEVVNSVREALEKPDAMPLTDVWTVAAAPIQTYTAALLLQIPRGPVPAAVAAAVLAAVRKAADARYALGADVWLNNLEGAAYVANVKKVQLLAPVDDITPGPSGAAYCTDIQITVEVV